MSKRGTRHQKLEPKEETRSQEEIFSHINKHLKGSKGSKGFGVFELPTCLDTPLRIIPTGSDSNRLKEQKIDLSKITKTEAIYMKKFTESVDILDSSVMILRNLESKKYKLIMPKKNSRYFKEGREKLKRRINKKMKHNGTTEGIMVTVTYDPIKLERLSAWEKVGKHISNLIDNINIHRKRKMDIKKRLTYFWVIEEQKGTGFPHVHIFFPNLKYLANNFTLIKMWKRMTGGSLDVKKAKCNMAKYIMKYIGKVKGFSIYAMAMLWKYKRRIYGFSRVFSVPSEKKEKLYELLGMFNKKLGIGFYEGGGYAWVGNVKFCDMFDCDVGKEDEVFESAEAVEYLKSQLW